MAEAILLKSGGGVGSEDVTASRADVLQGKRTVTTDSGDEVAEGTMVDRTIMDSTAVGISPQYPDLPTREGANLQLVADVNGIKRINLQPPIGHYDGNVYINRPASDFGNAAPGDILSGRTATSENGLKMPGTIPDHGIGKKAISSGINGSGLFYYFDPGYYPTDGYTGAWIYQALDQVRAADPNFIAANIKKGVTIFGQTGAFEGWVPTPQDLYYNGVFTKQFTFPSIIAQENTRLLIKSNQTRRLFAFAEAIDVRSYSQLIFEGDFVNYFEAGSNYAISLETGSGALVSGTTYLPTNTVVFNITNVATIPANTDIYIYSLKYGSYINRIRLA